MRLPGGPAAWAASAGILAVVFVMQSGIAPEAPFSGDNGMKLWQAQAFIDGGRYLPRSLPDGMSPTAYPPVLSTVSDRGLVSSYPASFPLVATLFGAGNLLLARIFVLVATAAAAWALSTLAGGGMAAGMAAFVLSGLAPYALVFWEHGPAMAPVLFWFLSFTVAVSKRGSRPFWILPLALAVYWRPELGPAAAGASAAVLASSGALPGRRRAALVWASILVLLLLAASIPGFLPARVLGNLPDFRSLKEYLSSRISILSSWTVQSGNPAGILAAVAWFGCLMLPARLVRTAWARTAASAATLILIYYWVRKSIGASSIFMLAPGLLILPFVPGRGSCRAAAVFERAALGSFLAVFLLSPTDGMFQFGPRFLLLPACLMALSVTRSCLDARGGVPLLVLAALLSGYGSLRGILFQQHFRESHEAVATALLQAPEGLVTATDEEWLPLVAWQSAVRRPVLYMDTPPVDGRLSGEPVLWISSRSTMSPEMSSEGFRGLRWSGTGAGEAAAPPGDVSPDPWEGIP